MPKTVKDDFLKKTIAEEPIKLPQSPFWEVFKRFGRDEAIALVINVAGTAIMAFILFRYNLISKNLRNLILALTGPIVEKVGFFPGHFKEARDVYNETPEDERENLNYYFKKAVKGGSKSLAQDIAFHDPLYIIGMWAGLNLYPATPAWMIAALSFIIAVGIVAFIEVAWKEIIYLNYKRGLKKKGFGEEIYFESRFFVSSRVEPKRVINKIAKEFGLGTIKKAKYNDNYIDCCIPEYNGRKVRMRLRKRNREKGKGFILRKEDEIKGRFMQTIQIVFTKAREMSIKELEQNRYFPVKKEKLYFILKEGMPKNCEEISDLNIRKCALKAKGKDKEHKIYFERMVAYDRKKMLASIDLVARGKEKPFYVVELKTYKENIPLLKEAMRFVMREFPVVQITHGKYDLTKKN
ncbi:MAG: hypothetical protein ABIH72_00295 [archaeon]